MLQYWSILVVMGTKACKTSTYIMSLDKQKYSHSYYRYFSAVSFSYNYKQSACHNKQRLPLICIFSSQQHNFVIRMCFPAYSTSRTISIHCDKSFEWKTIYSFQWQVMLVWLKTWNSFILSAIDLQLKNINEPLCCTGWHVFLIMMNMGICLFESIPHTVWNPPVHQMCICLHLKNSPHEKHYLLLLSKFSVPSCFGKLLTIFFEEMKLCICEPFFKICSFIKNK